MDGRPKIKDREKKFKRFRTQPTFLLFSLPEMVQKEDNKSWIGEQGTHFKEIFYFCDEFR